MKKIFNTIILLATITLLASCATTNDNGMNVQQMHAHSASSHAANTAATMISPMTH